MSDTVMIEIIILGIGQIRNLYHATIFQTPRNKQETLRGNIILEIKKGCFRN